MDAFAADTLVEWREWGPDAFANAAERNCPVLLSLSVPWSPECREMDRRTFGEPAIAANVNDAFVPIRVDADRRPRIRERYNAGGFPSTVFLTPAGEVLSAATFLGPDGFRGILDSVREAWESQGEAAGSIPRSVRSDGPPGGEVTPAIEEGMVEQLLGAYDEEYGGWGSDVKFPLPETVAFALVRAPDQATRTLEAIDAHLRDTADGGFYRYATRRDWSGASREKLLDENAALLRAFALGYRYTGEESYRETAEGIREYLSTTLWTGEAFAASQAGAEEYYELEPTERAAADPPHVDETVFADRNAVAVDALCALVAYADDERARRYARRARDHVCETLVEGGAVSHYRVGDASDPVETGDTGLLGDQSRLLGALTTSWQVLGEPGPAEAVADWTIEHLRTEGGAFRDGVADGAGLLDRPQYPLDGTVAVADGLLDLAALTGEDRYRRVARDAIAAFAGAADRMGVEVAGYAAVAARLLEPSAIAVGRPAGSDLHRAALRLADHETVVVPAADEPADAAALRVDGEVLGTAAGPAELEALVTSERGA